MGALHKLIIEHGADRAKEIVPPDERPYLRIAQAVLGDDSAEIATTYSGFCLLTALPHKRLEDNEVWRRVGHRVSITVQPGLLPTGKGQEKMWGVPFGARARLMLIYLQSTAIRTRSPEVEMGDSMADWLGRMNITPGGETYRSIQEQIRRIAACRLTFYWDETDQFAHASIIDGGRGLSMMSDVARPARQKALWQPTIRLSEGFFRALGDHPVPLDGVAIRELKEKSMALDIYIWLAYRLHSLGKPATVSWASLYDQFGGGYKLLRQFKPWFLQAAKAALAAYPDAKVEATSAGLVLYPSRPPVARLSA